MATQPTLRISGGGVGGPTAHTSTQTAQQPRDTNSSPKLVTRCASEGRLGQNEACRMRRGLYFQTGLRERIDMANPEQAGGHPLRARVNNNSDDTTAKISTSILNVQNSKELEFSPSPSSSPSLFLVISPSPPPSSPPSQIEQNVPKEHFSQIEQNTRESSCDRFLSLFFSIAAELKKRII